MGGTVQMSLLIRTATQQLKSESIQFRFVSDSDWSLIWAAEPAEKWKYLIPIAIEASLYQKNESQNVWNVEGIVQMSFMKRTPETAGARNRIEVNSTSLHKEIPPSGEFESELERIIDNNSWNSWAPGIDINVKSKWHKYPQGNTSIQWFWWIWTGGNSSDALVDNTSWNSWAPEMEVFKILIEASFHQRRNPLKHGRVRVIWNCE